MDVLRRMVLWVVRVLFQLELITWLSVTTLVLMVGSSGPIKQALQKANIYARLPDIALKQTAAMSDNGVSTPLYDETIQKVVKDQFPPDKLQGYSENFVDGIYSWLTGKSDKPNFRIDLTGTREAIAEAVAQRGVERLNSLPACTSIPTGSLDPFSISCRPPGSNSSLEKQVLKNEVLSNKDFLPNSVITADQLPKSQNGQTFSEKYHNAPKLFELLRKLPWILGGLGILTALTIIWLSSEKRRGVRTVGRMILTTGSFVLVTTILFGVLLPKLSATLQARFVTGDAAPLLNDAFKSLLQTSNKALYVTSGGLTALGAVILLVERFVKPQKETAIDETVLPAEETKTEAEATKPE